MRNIQHLMDDAKCYEPVRELRWPAGVGCAHCDSAQVTQQGRDTAQPDRQKYYCPRCGRYCDDLTGTVLAGHHPPLPTWMVCLYVRGLNLSKQPIARELELNQDAVQRLTEQRRQGVVANRPQPVLSGAVACDQGYVVAGHQGQPEAVKKKGRPGRRRRLQGARGRGTLAKAKPPTLGLIQRRGEVVRRMLDTVQPGTLEPVIRTTVAVGTQFYTAE